MRNRLVLYLIIALAATGACKKKVGTSDAIKADLKNYLQVELPKADSLFALMALLSEKFKEKEAGESQDLPKFDDKKEGQKLAQAVEALSKIKTSTEDVGRLHAELQSGVADIQVSFQKLAQLEKEASGFSAFTAMLKAMKNIVSGIESLQDWRKHLEAGCKANGLEAEFAEFEKKYGWGG
ncbi:hypothetical protein [Turneriella parva]|uniref:Lipoprotein n=1 Tax=Turneriella parva (strain ATCC BAA-1111 / DSM 21527 / NCTC 11395 / H) TaxID=869212 RepID=I4B5D4_TURPD|nr:hypothetical protein [Turneriella parva]AFM12491.1 hypothetical protein Turpa_1844 [Turneriella parva DSM 21527]